MTEAEIIKQAKHFFGKDRSSMRAAVLAKDFTGKEHRRWRKELKPIIPVPFRFFHGIFDDVVLWMRDGQTEEINWNWVGDLSWTFEILLNEGIKSGYDWDKKLALRCGGTVRLLHVYVCDLIPCYTYDLFYMTYNKAENYYGSGPLGPLGKTEKEHLKRITRHMNAKGLTYVPPAWAGKTVEGIYSDTNSEGEAKLFDVLFSDTVFYHTEHMRFSDEEMHDANGQSFRWREYYHKNGTLKERIESRWTTGGDYFKLVLNAKGQITQVDVTRRKIGNKKHAQFTWGIREEFKKQAATKK